MNAITPISSDPITLTSLEIAELVEKRHDNVKRTIETLAARGAIASPQTEEKAETGGRPGTIYRVGKRDSYVIVAQLSPAFTARLVDRWQELESGAAQIPKSLPEALRLAADMAEQKARVETALALAAPKANALDRIATFSEGSYCMRDAAKVLQVPERKFIQYLDGHNYIFLQSPGQWRAYAEARKAGLVEQKTTTGEKPDGSEWQSVQVRITAKGMTKLAQAFERDGAPA